MKYGQIKLLLKEASSENTLKKEDYGKGMATIAGAAGSGALMSTVLPIHSQFSKKHPTLRGALYAGGLSSGGLLTRSLVDKYRGRQLEKNKEASIDMPSFLSQDRPEKVKEIYRALKRDHPEYSAEKKARIANAMGKEAEVEYRGKTFPGYNQPIDSDRPEKKKMVLAKKGDQVKLIHFGQKGYKHNYSDEAKKNYLTRSAGIRGKDGSLTANDKFSANYWARRELWPQGEPADGSSRGGEKRAAAGSDKKRVSARDAFGTLFGVGTLAGVAGSGLSTAAYRMPGGVHETLSKTDPEAVAEFNDLLKKTRVAVSTGSATLEDAKRAVAASPIFRRLPAAIQDELAKNVHVALKSAGPQYNPAIDKVFMGDVRNADILAHEVGHATGGLGKKILQGAIMPGKIVGKGAGLAALIRGVQGVHARGPDAEQKFEQSRNLGIASATANWAPTLLEEARATARATMAAAPDLRGKRLKALLPAYATYVGAALPAVTLPATAEILRRQVSRKGAEREKRASTDDFGHKAELAGLGVLAAPAAAHLAAKVPGLRRAEKPVSQFLHDSPSTEHAVELGGLGILAAPSLKHYIDKRKQDKKG